MREIAAVAGLSIASAVVATRLAPAASREILAGMAGPLLAVVLTWLALQRTARRNPAGVQSAMIGGFLVKLVFFALYVVAVARMPEFRAQAFAASFGIYFVTLYVIEAVMLRRLFAGAGRPVPPVDERPQRGGE